MGLDLHEAEFLFHGEALDGSQLLVHQFSGRESLSQPFEFLIDLVSKDANLDLDAPIGEAACLTLRGRLFDGSRYSRYVHGVIERFVLVGAGSRQSRYQAKLVPTLKQLFFTRNSRIFQKSSGPSVTQQVLKQARVPSDWVSTMLHGTYGDRDYCVQYQESDLDFVSRLWEEEGIFYFFEHQRDQDKLVLGDGGHAFPKLPVYGEAQLRDKPHLHEECLFEFQAESVLRPGATVLRDFKFKQPTLDLEASAKKGKFADYQMYFFPGEYVDPALGQHYAKLRLEELQCQRNLYVGAGSVRAMLPGHKFSLRGHRRDDCNQEYLIVSVEHHGAQPQALLEEGHAKQEPSYQNRIECIPIKVPFRPARVTPRPTISGVQTAVVVGPPGEEIHCDDHGRIKVKFHWDRSAGRDDNSSCWIRVSQPWGGAGQGGMFIPRVGQEVVVQFLEGDPDRPLIVGRVYNGENPVPHGLPAAKNISTIRSASTPGGGGFNEIKFNDSAGGELFFTHAQRDKTDIVCHDHDQHVKNDQQELVEQNRKATVGVNETLKVGQNQSSHVGGDQTNLICKNRMTTVVMNDMETVGLNKSLHVGVAYVTQVGVTMSTSVGGAKTVTVGGAMTTSVGAVATENIGSSLIKKIGKIASETVGLLKKIAAGKKVQIHSGGAKIELRSSGKKVLIQAGSSKIEMKPGKLTLDSGAGATIELDGAKIKISAAEIEINGSAQVGVKGTLINAEASGVQTIKGSLVKINC